MEERMTGELRFLQRLNKFEMAVELDILRSGLIHVGGTAGNDPDDLDRKQIRNWEYRNLDRYYKTFAGKPILIAYVGRRVGDGHNSQTKTDLRTGEAYESYMAPTAERIVGMVSEDESDLTLIEREGNTWERVKGRIWTNYAPELTEKLMRTGSMSVSVETNVLEAHTENDVEVMDVWEGLGVTVLGDGVAPAVPGANVRVLAALQQEFEDMKLRVAALREEEGEPQLAGSEPEGTEETKSIKKGMKKSMTKALRKELEAKFPDHFVGGVSEDGKTVALLSKSGVDAYSYTFEDSDKGNVIAERMQGAELVCTAKCGERDVEIDITHVTGFYDKEVADLSAENKELKERLEKLEAAQKAAEARESARRIKAAKDAAERQLAECNANRAEDEKFAAECIAEICEKCEKGDYSVCEDEDGNWTGEDAVCAAVRDVCMKKQMEMDKTKTSERRMAAQASQKVYPWEAGFGGEVGTGNSIDDLYASM